MSVPQVLGELRFRVACVALVFFAALMALAQLASAHHSFTYELTADGEQTIEIIEGSVRVFRILNPHGALIVDADKPGGDTEAWLLELSSAAALRREGWTDELLSSGDAVTVSILPSTTPNRARLRALLIHGKTDGDPARLMVSYGIRGDTPVMQRLRERLPVCGTIDRGYTGTECFLIDAEASHALAEEFPAPMGYVMP